MPDFDSNMTYPYFESWKGEVYIDGVDAFEGILWKKYSEISFPLRKKLNLSLESNQLPSFKGIPKDKPPNLGLNCFSPFNCYIYPFTITVSHETQHCMEFELYGSITTDIGSSNVLLLSRSEEMESCKDQLPNGFPDNTHFIIFTFTFSPFLMTSGKSVSNNCANNSKHSGNSFIEKFLKKKKKQKSVEKQNDAAVCNLKIPHNLLLKKATVRLQKLNMKHIYNIKQLSNEANLYKNVVKQQKKKEYSSCNLINYNTISTKSPLSECNISEAVPSNEISQKVAIVHDSSYTGTLNSIHDKSIYDQKDTFNCHNELSKMVDEDIKNNVDNTYGKLKVDHTDKRKVINHAEGKHMVDHVDIHHKKIHKHNRHRSYSESKRIHMYSVHKEKYTFQHESMATNISENKSLNAEFFYANEHSNKHESSHGKSKSYVMSNKVPADNLYKKVFLANSDSTYNSDHSCSDYKGDLLSNGRNHGGIECEKSSFKKTLLMRETENNSHSKYKKSKDENNYEKKHKEIGHLNYSNKKHRKSEHENNSDKKHRKSEHENNSEKKHSENEHENNSDKHGKSEYENNSNKKHGKSEHENNSDKQHGKSENDNNSDKIQRKIEHDNNYKKKHRESDHENYPEDKHGEKEHEYNSADKHRASRQENNSDDKHRKCEHENDCEKTHRKRKLKYQHAFDKKHRKRILKHQNVFHKKHRKSEHEHNSEKKHKEKKHSHIHKDYKSHHSKHKSSSAEKQHSTYKHNNKHHEFYKKHSHKHSIPDNYTIDNSRRHEKTHKSKDKTKSIKRKYPEISKAYVKCKRLKTKYIMYYLGMSEKDYISKYLSNKDSRDYFSNKQFLLNQSPNIKVPHDFNKKGMSLLFLKSDLNNNPSDIKQSVGIKFIEETNESNKSLNSKVKFLNFNSSSKSLKSLKDGEKNFGDYYIEKPHTPFRNMKKPVTPDRNIFKPNTQNITTEKPSSPGKNVDKPSTPGRSLLIKKRVEDSADNADVPDIREFDDTSTIQTPSVDRYALLKEVFTPSSEIRKIIDKSSLEMSPEFIENKPSQCNKLSDKYTDTEIKLKTFELVDNNPSNNFFMTDLSQNIKKKLVDIIDKAILLSSPVSQMWEKELLDSSFSEEFDDKQILELQKIMSEYDSSKIPNSFERENLDDLVGPPLVSSAEIPDSMDTIIPYSNIQYSQKSFGVIEHSTNNSNDLKDNLNCRIKISSNLYDDESSLNNSIHLPIRTSPSISLKISKRKNIDDGNETSNMNDNFTNILQNKQCKDNDVVCDTLIISKYNKSCEGPTNRDGILQIDKSKILERNTESNSLNINSLSSSKNLGYIQSNKILTECSSNDNKSCDLNDRCITSSKFKSNVNLSFCNSDSDTSIKNIQSVVNDIFNVNDGSFLNRDNVDEGNNKPDDSSASKGNAVDNRTIGGELTEIPSYNINTSVGYEVNSHIIDNTLLSFKVTTDKYQSISDETCATSLKDTSLISDNRMCIDLLPSLPENYLTPIVSSIVDDYAPAFSSKMFGIYPPSNLSSHSDESEGNITVFMPKQSLNNLLQEKINIYENENMPNYNEAYSESHKDGAKTLNKTSGANISTSESNFYVVTNNVLTETSMALAKVNESKMKRKDDESTTLLQSSNSSDQMPSDYLCKLLKSKTEIDTNISYSSNSNNCVKIKEPSYHDQTIDSSEFDYNNSKEIKYVKSPVSLEGSHLLDEEIITNIDSEAYFASGTRLKEKNSESDNISIMDSITDKFILDNSEDFEKTPLSKIAMHDELTMPQSNENGDAISSENDLISFKDGVPSHVSTVSSVLRKKDKTNGQEIDNQSEVKPVINPDTLKYIANSIEKNMENSSPISLELSCGSNEKVSQLTDDCECVQLLHVNINSKEKYNLLNEDVTVCSEVSNDLEHNISKGNEKTLVAIEREKHEEIKLTETEKQNDKFVLEMKFKSNKNTIENDVEQNCFDVDMETKINVERTVGVNEIEKDSDKESVVEIYMKKQADVEMKTSKQIKESDIECETVCPLGKHNSTDNQEIVDLNSSSDIACDGKSWARKDCDFPLVKTNFKFNLKDKSKSEITEIKLKNNVISVQMKEKSKSISKDSFGKVTEAENVDFKMSVILSSKIKDTAAQIEDKPLSLDKEYIYNDENIDSELIINSLKDIPTMTPKSKISLNVAETNLTFESSLRNKNSSNSPILSSQNISTESVLTMENCDDSFDSFEVSSDTYYDATQLFPEMDGGSTGQSVENLINQFSDSFLKLKYNQRVQNHLHSKYLAVKKNLMRFISFREFKDSLVCPLFGTNINKMKQRLKMQEISYSNLSRGGHAIILKTKIRDLLLECSDLINNTRIKFGMIKKQDSNYAQKIFHEKALYVLHHSAFIDPKFENFLKMIAVENSSSSRKHRVVVAIPVKVFCFILKLFYNARSSDDELFYDITEFSIHCFARNVDKEICHILPDDNIDPSTSIEDMVNYTKSVHSAFDFAHKQVCLVLGSTLENLSNSDEYYKVLTLSQLAQAKQCHQ